MTIQNLRNPYRPEIDGLRAIAVTSVVLFHSGLAYFSGGFVGVDVFFVISGYLITSHIYKEITLDRFSFAVFYARRAKRILPALLLVLILSFALAILLLSPRELMRFSLSGISAIFGSSNLYYWYFADYFAPSSDSLPMLMTWSLGVEEQFYAFFPVILLILVKYWKRSTLAIVTLITALSFFTSVFLLNYFPVLAFYMLPPRAWELGFGAILAIYEIEASAQQLKRRFFSHIISVAALAAIIYCVVVYSETTTFPGFAALPVVVGATALIGIHRSIVSSILSFPPLVFVGRVSYSWYLWHWPLLAFARCVSIGPLSTHFALSIVSIAFAFSIITYYFVEQPFRKKSKSTSTVFFHYTAAVMFVALPLGLAFLSHGVPWRLPSSISRLEASNSIREGCLIQYGKTRPSTQIACQPSLSARPAIALLGDSHAAALAEALRHAANDAGYDLLVLTKVSCPPLGTITRFMPNHPGHDSECAEFNKRALGYVTNDTRVRGVILAGYWSAPLIEAAQGSRYVVAGESNKSGTNDNLKNLKYGLIEQMEAFQAAKKSVLVIQDVPIFDFDPVVAILDDEIPLRRRFAQVLNPAMGIVGASRPSTIHADVINESRAAVEKAISEVPGAKLYDPSKELCVDGMCKYADTYDALYIDNQHLSRSGADLLSTSIMAAQVTGVALNSDAR